MPSEKAAIVSLRLVKPLPYCDTQIAATAIANGMVLVTRNVSDFKTAKEKSFLNVENWFSDR